MCDNVTGVGKDVLHKKGTDTTEKKIFSFQFDIL